MAPRRSRAAPATCTTSSCRGSPTARSCARVTRTRASSASTPGARRVDDERADNLTDVRYQFSHGDVDRAFAEAAAVVEGVYRLNFVTTCCLETMVAVAEWDAQGGLTIWSTTQVPFLYQRELAQALGITGDHVRVMHPPVGGNC